MLAQSTIATPRLILRPLSLTDAPSIQVLASERSIADTMISIPHPYPASEAERYLDRQFAEFEAGYSITFAIERKFDSVLIGVIEIRDIEREHSQAELSFWLAVAARGHGYMSEALQPIIQFGFEPLELNRLYAYRMVRNSGL
jgi:RimJ/RimL family protein N-acetyltransferase